MYSKWKESWVPSLRIKVVSPDGSDLARPSRNMIEASIYIETPDYKFGQVIVVQAT